ncbi:ABC transporter ATP-binding protein [Microvirga lotononidis]|uniref:ATPase component of ABC-type sugar transporter n=1 Tax=Microvirga lotononidis TaxID=864069 RepID=I4YL47_9HYPH|nr:ABC transporter ATP-binding protein [Microvirga lotononidis]EIM24689.1 ATPase component of ABC-type sugar transporter [Microvirga lotononidis]WQO26700.1 ABC transporter ATP-binding protein [Microvirga lotononidis]
MTIALSQFDEVRLDHVSRDFGALNALRDVSLTIRRREFIALLGPSGCGKSTTLNCIAGLLPVTGGAIWLDKSRVDTLRPEERGFGMVFQNYALFPHLNVRQNIGFGLKMRGRPKAEIDRKVDEALSLVRLQGQENKLPGQLSGGQQQRVAIARAIVIEPPLVLMDEPLSNLDAKLRLEMRAEIRRIHNELGATTIYVTHDQDEALSLADRIVVLRDGVVRQVGTPKELYEAPSHLDVADFMGFRNKLKGKVVGTEGGRAILDVEGARISGVARETLSAGSSAYAAIRPDDLMVGEAGPNAIAANVDTIEYRGREFVGTAHSAGGLDFVFRSHQPVEPGSNVHLRADDQRVLVFAEPIQGRH